MFRAQIPTQKVNTKKPLTPIKEESEEDKAKEKYEKNLKLFEDTQAARKKTKEAKDSPKSALLAINSYFPETIYTPKILQTKLLEFKEILKKAEFFNDSLENIRQVGAIVKIIHQCDQFISELKYPKGKIETSILKDEATLADFTVWLNDVKLKLNAYKLSVESAVKTLPKKKKKKRVKLKESSPITITENPSSSAASTSTSLPTVDEVDEEKKHDSISFAEHTDETNPIHEEQPLIPPLERQPSNPAVSNQNPWPVPPPTPDPRPQPKWPILSILCGLFAIGAGIGGIIFSWGLATPFCMSLIGLGSSMVAGGVQKSRELEKDLKHSVIPQQKSIHPGNKKSILSILGGISLIGLGIAGMIFSFGIATPVSAALIGSGASLLTAGAVNIHHENQRYEKTLKAVQSEQKKELNLVEQLTHLFGKQITSSEKNKVFTINCGTRVARITPSGEISLNKPQRQLARRPSAQIFESTNSEELINTFKQEILENKGLINLPPEQTNAALEIFKNFEAKDQLICNNKNDSLIISFNNCEVEINKQGQYFINKQEKNTQEVQGFFEQVKKAVQKGILDLSTTQMLKVFQTIQGYHQAYPNDDRPLSPQLSTYGVALRRGNHTVYYGKEGNDFDANDKPITPKSAVGYLNPARR